MSAHASRTHASISSSSSECPAAACAADTAACCSFASFLASARAALRYTHGLALKIPLDACSSFVPTIQSPPNLPSSSATSSGAVLTSFVPHDLSTTSYHQAMAVQSRKNVTQDAGKAGSGMASDLIFAATAIRFSEPSAFFCGLADASSAVASSTGVLHGTL